MGLAAREFIMKKITLLMFSLLFTINAFACFDNSKITKVQLNDVKTLTAYSLYDEVKEKHFFFNDDVKADMLFYTIRNSAGVKTHGITLDPQEKFIVVTVVDLSTIDDVGLAEEVVYKGQYSMMRGCNEIVQIKN